jgi:hypothetical protein
MAITYFCNDADGNLYTRFSKNHLIPLYRAAAVFRSAERRPAPASKAQVSYAKEASYARVEANRRRYFDATEIVEVRGYVGRHTQEPVQTEGAL